MRIISSVTLGLLLLAAGCRTIGVSRTEGGYAEVRPTVAHEMILDSRDVIVIDFRPLDEYWGSFGHIAGAISVPLGAIETRLPELIPYQATTVIVYGDTEEEARSGARILAAAGFPNVVRIQGGIRNWVDLGYQTVTAD